MRLKITTVGNSAGVVLPKTLLARLRLGKGDLLYAREQPDGIRLVIHDAGLERQVHAAEAVMREHRGLLRQLAGR